MSERFSRFLPGLRRIDARIDAITRQYSMLLWASIAGLLGALATLVFRDTLSALQRLLVGHSGSFVANITMRALPHYRPTYEMPAFPSMPNGEGGLFLVLGLLAGLSTPLFLRLIALCKHRFQALAWPLPLRLAAGGLLVGLLSIPVPEVWGNGYSVVNSLLYQPMLWSTVLMILLFKVVATALTTGSGAIGGIFTPTIFVGAAVGTLFAQAAHAVWPAFAGATSAYAMVGMGAFLAAATGAPLMAIFMIFEMTLSYQIMLPLMLACVSAYFVAGAIDGAAMYDITTRRKQQAAVLSRLRTTHMAELVKPAVTLLPMATATFADASRLFREHAVKYLYLVDQSGRFLGVVASQDITAALADADRSRPLQYFLRRDFLHVLTPDMSLDQALALFLQHEGERLPIVRSVRDPVLLGVIYKTALLDAYSRLNRSGLSTEAG